MLPCSSRAVSRAAAHALCCDRAPGTVALRWNINRKVFLFSSRFHSKSLFSLSEALGSHLFSNSELSIPWTLLHSSASNLLTSFTILFFNEFTLFFQLLFSFSKYFAPLAFLSSRLLLRPFGPLVLCSGCFLFLLCFLMTVDSSQKNNDNCRGGQHSQRNVVCHTFRVEYFSLMALLVEDSICFYKSGESKDMVKDGQQSRKHWKILNIRNSQRL